MTQKILLQSLLQKFRLETSFWHFVTFQAFRGFSSLLSESFMSLLKRCKRATKKTVMSKCASLINRISFMIDDKKFNMYISIRSFYIDKILDRYQVHIKILDSHTLHSFIYAPGLPKKINLHLHAPSQPYIIICRHHITT